jgi:methionyl-tRNA formyltransferase
MKIIFFGTPHFAVPSLERLIAESDLDVVAVVTQPDKRRGRGNQMIPSPIKTVATQHQLPVWQPQRLKKDSETLNQLRQAQADAFVVVAYGQILSQEILDQPRLGCINAHGSILPRYRGAAPIQWCLYHGESETGITTMLMDAGMDTGAMLLTATRPISLLENALDLAKALSEMAADLLIETLHGLNQQTITPIPQDNSQATYAPLIQKADYQIDWSRGAIALHNQIRGFYPNCVTNFRGQSLKIQETLPLKIVPDIILEAMPEELRYLERMGRELIQRVTEETWQPGMIVEVIKNAGPVIATGDGLLLLRTVQPSGKRSQSGWDFANGSRLDIGEMLE